MWSAGAESWTQNSVERPSKGMLLCPLPHCGVEITLGMCTETDLKLQASVHALQSGACRQQDWHDVPSPLTPDPQNHELLPLCCANLPPAASKIHQQTQLTFSLSPTPLFFCATAPPLWLPFLPSVVAPETFALWCSFIGLVLSEACAKVCVMLSLACFVVWALQRCAVSRASAAEEDFLRLLTADNLSRERPKF